MLLVFAAPARAGGSSKGELRFEGRGYLPDGSGATDDYSLALSAWPELSYTHGPWQLGVSALTRVDLSGDSRNTAYLKNAFVGFHSGRLRIRVGSQVLSWTALRAFHPADVINSRNFDGPIENLDKIGEPMVEVRLALGDGYLSGYYMPMRIAPRLPTARSRLDVFEIDFGDPLWVGRDGHISGGLFDNQWAVHLGQRFGGADIAVYALQQDDREQPTITRDLTAGALRPTYHYVTQLGLTYAQRAGPFVFKLEGAYRRFSEPDVRTDPIAFPPASHLQAAGGIACHFAIAGTSATLFSEGQAFLLAGDAQLAQLSLFTPFQRDVLLGYEQDFNDPKQVKLVAFAMLGLERIPHSLGEARDDYLAALSYRQLVTGRWGVSVSVRSRRAPAAGGVPPVALDGAEVAVTRTF